MILNFRLSFRMRGSGMRGHKRELRIHRLKRIYDFHFVSGIVVSDSGTRVDGHYRIQGLGCILNQDSRFEVTRKEERAFLR